MKTLEQLSELSDYEINCAVAEKLGHVIYNKITRAHFNDHSNDLLISPRGVEQVWVDYCGTPNDYMPIAIEHGIDIKFDSVDSNEFDTGCDWVSCSYLNSKCDMAFYPRKKTGRAVCIAFLLMELDK